MESNAGPSQPSPAPALPISRTFAFVLAVLLLVLSSVVALLQKPRPDPYESARFPSPEWWLYPVDTNAALSLPAVNVQLNAIFALPGAQQVWAVGDAGAILHSADGGRSWTQQTLSAVPAQPPAPRPGPPNTPGDASPNVPAPEPLLTLKPAALDFVFDLGSKSAPIQTATVTNIGSAAAGITGVRLTGVDQQQFQLADGGKLCNEKVIDPGGVCTVAVQFKPDTSGTYNAALTVTYKGGRPVEVELRGESRALRPNPAVQSAPGQLNPRPQGQAPAGPKGALDKGAIQPQRFFDLVNPFATVFAAEAPPPKKNAPDTDKAKSGGQPDPHTGDDLVWVVFSDAAHGVVDGRDGLEWSTSDGGATWQPAGKPTAANTQRSGDFSINAVRIRRAAANQVLGVASVPGAQIKQICTLPDGRAWAAGGRGIILYSPDGKTWRHQLQDAARIPPVRPDEVRLWPAPWYYLSLVMIAALLVVAAREPTPQTPATITIADQFASDRPITAAEPDPLDFRAVTLGLSRFLRNAHTEPPLTVAVTGEWGTGKSSLMNLLREDLNEWGFRPVWFNAWHHQKEESLLAALLQNIRLQAIPQFWRPEAWLFRARLINIRLHRNLGLTLLLLSLIALTVGAVLAIPRPPGHEQETSAYHLFDELRSNPTKLPADLPPQLLFLISLSGGLFSLWKGLQAFGVRPSALLAAASGKAGLSALEEQTSFRYRFARDFEEVTDALGPRSMIIFIDDLDRCQPGQVVEVLEALNFLMTSGGCFIVLGMARDRVERCVGLTFKDVAGELMEAAGDTDAARKTGPDKPGDEEEAARQRRAEFARQYLDKLINIEVPVPRLTAAQTLKLLARKKAEAASQPQSALQWQPWATRLGQFSPFILAALVLAVGILFGQRVGRDWAPAANTVAETSSKPAAGTPDVPAGNPSPAQIATLTPPLPFSHALLYFLLLPGAIVFGTAAYWILTRRAGLVVDDSKVFTDAIEIWSPLIFARQNTPRAVKRFLNRLRYIASRQRPPQSTHPLWMNMLWTLRLAVRPAAETYPVSVADIPESALVALASLQQFDETWISLPAFLDDPEAVSAALRKSLGNDWLERYNPVNKHRQSFETWTSVTKHREAFLNLTVGLLNESTPTCPR